MAATHSCMDRATLQHQPLSARLIPAAAVLMGDACEPKHNITQTGTFILTHRRPVVAMDCRYAIAGGMGEGDASWHTGGAKARNVG